MGAKTIFKSKTFWMAIVTFLTAFVSWGTGQIPLWGVVTAAVTAFGVIIWRDKFDTNLKNFFNKFKWWKDGVVLAFCGTALGFVYGWLSGDISITTMLISVFASFVGMFLKSGATATANQ